MKKQGPFSPFRITPEMVEERTTITEKKLSVYRVKMLRCFSCGMDAKARGYYAIVEAIKTSYYPVYESE